MLVFGNAFSVNMLKRRASVSFVEAELWEVKQWLSEEKEFLSIIGHKGTADLLSVKLGTQIPVNRVNYKLKEGDSLIICLPTQRLEEGKILTKDELESIEVKFWLAELN
jgi:hypothetical protein